MKNIVLLLLLLLIPLELFPSETAIDSDLIKGRDISELPSTDGRIDGYRKDYKKVKGSHIQLPSRYDREKEINEKEINEKEINEKEINEKEEQVEVEKNKPVELAKPLLGYTGGNVNGLREGKGKLVLENGDIYEGSWQKGKKSGHGIYVYSSGLKYNGSWKDDKMDGEGSLIFPNGSFYYGSFRSGTITGTGMFKYSDGAVYEGGWKEGKWNGEGVFRLSDGRFLKAIFANHQVVQILKDEKADKIDEVEINDEDN